MSSGTRGASCSRVLASPPPRPQPSPTSRPALTSRPAPPSHPAPASCLAPTSIPHAGKTRAVEGASNEPPHALEVNVLNLAGRAPLHYAAAKGHRAVVKLLLDAGAKVDLPDGQGDTALLVAAYSGHEPVVRLLLDHHGLSARATHGLRTAHAQGHASRLHHCPALTLPYLCLTSPLSRAFLSNSRHPLRRPVRVDGAAQRLQPRPRPHRTAPHRARRRHQRSRTARPDTPQYASRASLALSLAGAFNPSTPGLCAPPHPVIAAGRGHRPVVALLLEHGADLFARTDNAETAYDMAAIASHLPTCDDLVFAAEKAGPHERALGPGPSEPHRFPFGCERGSRARQGRGVDRQRVRDPGAPGP